MKRRLYHHGNLKESLVNATLKLVEDIGPQSFRMAEIAKNVNVSPAAPYRHFKSRDDLFQTIAFRGFLKFGTMLEKAHKKFRDNPRQALRESGRVYLKFASKHQGYYILMFESSVNLDAKDELAAASMKAKSYLERIVDQLVAQSPSRDFPPTDLVCEHIWALSHGVVELFDRRTMGGTERLDTYHILDTGVSIYLRGLGLGDE